MTTDQSASEMRPLQACGYPQDSQSEALTSRLAPPRLALLQKSSFSLLSFSQNLFSFSVLIAFQLYRVTQKKRNPKIQFFPIPKNIF